MTSVFVTDRKQHHIISSIVSSIRQREKVYLIRYQNIFHVLTLLQKAESWKQFCLASTFQTLSPINEIYPQSLFKTTFLKQNAFHSSYLPPLYPIMPLYHNHNFFLLLLLPCFLAWFLRVLAVRLLKTYSILHSKVIILYLYCI